MPIVRTFVRVRPPARGDGVAYTHVRVEEAPDSSGAPGAWTTVDTLALTTIDSDPAQPRWRTITTALAARDQAWYRLVWVDADDATAAAEPFPVLPLTIDNVATLLRSRTLADGEEAGTFNDETNPTGTEAARFLAIAAQDVDGRIGRWVPDNFRGRRNQAAAFRAAGLIEASYHPDETADEEGSPRPVYFALAEAELAALVRDLQTMRLA